MTATVLVMAKRPIPGRVKTRLCPPCTPHEAARLAEAALQDTIEASLGTPGVRTTLVMDGPPDPWLPPDVEVLPQVGGGLDERIGAAFAEARGPAVVIGMDTPHVTPYLLGRAVALLGESGVDAVLGPAVDGGWWALGLQEPDPAVTLGVPMSRSDTGTVQRTRLDELGLRTMTLPVLEDVDDIEDARIVARAAPTTRFAAAFRSVLAGGRGAVP